MMAGKSDIMVNSPVIFSTCSLLRFPLRLMDGFQDVYVWTSCKLGITTE